MVSSGPRSGDSDQQEREDNTAERAINMAMDMDDEDIDEDEVIDVAEQVFVRIAEAIVK